MNTPDTGSFRQDGAGSPYESGYRADQGSVSGIYSSRLSESIKASIKLVIRITRSDPFLLLTATRLLSVQKRAAARRNDLASEGLQVPAVVMFSLTHQCNLACHGCYMRSLHRAETPEMTSDQLMILVSECVDLGVSFLVMAGGEPLVRKNEILMLARAHPDLIVAIFTNGLLIDESLATEFGKLPNIVPILSIEGTEEMTDSRRCEGTYEAVLRAFSLLKKRRIFFGCSVTVTRENYQDVTGDSFIQEMITHGCRLFAYVEYVPIDEGTRGLLISDEQRSDLNRYLSGFSDQYPALFIGFPGDEETFGGCLSAGRGFIHISPSGDLEPCPAAPFSDVNVTRVSLRDALGSDLLARIRSHHEMLTESGGGCALWTNRNWVSSLLTEGKK